MLPARPGAPQHWGEHQHRQKEERAGDFEPELSADGAEGLEKTEEASTNITRGFARCPTPSSCIDRPIRLRDRAGVLHVIAGESLAGGAACNAQSDSKYPSYSLRSHLGYDGSSGGHLVALAHPMDDARLRGARSTSKVIEIHSPLPAHSPRRALPEVNVTSRLRELIQQLGEAIHESVIESEQIAGVVQDIRKHGFDVLLMLEATIGLNEVKEGENADGSAEGEGTSFTKSDVNFLRSLRISIEGEDENEDTDETQTD